MNEIDTLVNPPDSENDKKYSNTRDKFDFKMPCDMKSFWKTIDEKFFTIEEFCDAFEINYKIHSFGKYGKNNPNQIEKFFGMHLYIDKYDYQLNNLQNEDISEEIQLIEEKLNDMEESNFKITKFFKEILEKENEVSSSDFSKINFRDCIVKRMRLNNIINQIHTLQLKQFSESVMNIKKCLKKDNYILVFDPCEKIEPIVLGTVAYRGFIRLRDTLNSTSIYDLFQEKIHSKVSPNEKNKGKRKYKQRSNSLNNKKVPKYKQIKFLKKHKKQRKSKITDDEAQIINNIAKNYNICHHCKQRKPLEVLTRCKTNNGGKVEAPSKHFVINNTTVFRKNKNFIITNYMGDPREILENYLIKKSQYICSRYFCNLCLKGSYDLNLEIVRENNDWMCPCCLGTCFCSRCLRYDQMLKLIALFISLDGDMNELFQYMIQKSVILERLSKNLVISKLIIIRNESHIKVNKLNKDTIKINKDENENIDKSINIEKKFIEKLLGYRDYLNSQLLKINSDKKLIRESFNLAQKNIQKSLLEKETIKKNSPVKSRSLNITGNISNYIKTVDMAKNIIPEMNNFKLESNNNNINIFTNKNINLNTQNKKVQGNLFENNNTVEIKNKNIVTGNQSLDHTNQKLNFNFNFNFPSEECTKFMNRKRQRHQKKNNKNFNVNLNLNVNLNTTDNNINSQRNHFNKDSFNKSKDYEKLPKKLKENRFASNFEDSDENANINSIHFPFNKPVINPLEKRMRFINLKTRSSSDLLKESFVNKYLGDDIKESSQLIKNNSLDFEKYSKLYDRQKNKNSDENDLTENKNEKNQIQKLSPNQQKNELEFDFDLLNINGINKRNSINNSNSLSEKNHKIEANKKFNFINKYGKKNKLNGTKRKRIRKFSRILRNLEDY